MPVQNVSLKVPMFSLDVEEDVSSFLAKEESMALGMKRGSCIPMRCTQKIAVSFDRNGIGKKCSNGRRGGATVMTSEKARECHVERPFSFLVIDSLTGMILVMGRVTGSENIITSGGE